MTTCQLVSHVRLGAWGRGRFGQLAVVSIMSRGHVSTSYAKLMVCNNSQSELAIEVSSEYTYATTHNPVLNRTLELGTQR